MTDSPFKTVKEMNVNGWWPDCSESSSPKLWSKLHTSDVSLYFLKISFAMCFQNQLAIHWWLLFIKFMANILVHCPKFNIKHHKCIFTCYKEHQRMRCRQIHLYVPVKSTQLRRIELSFIYLKGEWLLLSNLY